MFLDVTFLPGAFQYAPRPNARPESLFQLPFDCQVAVLCHLDAISDWANFRLVSRHANDVANCAVHAISVKPNRQITGSDLESAVAQFPNLVEVDLPDGSLADVDNDVIMALGVFCPNLQKVKLGTFWELPPYTTYELAALVALFRGCRRLQEVIITMDGSSLSIPSSIWNLPKLRTLSIENWPAVNRIPDDVTQLTALSSFHLKKVNILSFCGSFGNLTHLESLCIESVANLDSLSKSIHRLTNLKTLSLRCSAMPGWHSQKRLMEALRQLSLLTSLSAIHCFHLAANHWNPLRTIPLLQELSVSLPPAVKLSDLTAGSLWGPRLQSLHLFGSFQSGKIDLPLDIHQLLPGLKSLSVSGFIGRVVLPPRLFHGLSLVQLAIDGDLESLPATIGLAKGLRKLSLTSVDSLTFLPSSIVDLLNLEQLTVNSKCLAAMVDSLWKLESLNSLEIKAQRLAKFPDTIGGLRQLSSLHLASDLAGWIPGGVIQLSGLEEITIDCPNLQYLPTGFGSLSSLRRLTFSSGKIKSLSGDIYNLVSLRYLELNCPMMRKLPEGGNEWGNLTRLVLGNCQELVEISDNFCSSLGRLRHLSLLNGSQIQKLPEGLRNLKSLVRLDLMFLERFDFLPESISHLHLKVLLLQSLPRLRDLPEGLGSLGEDSVIYINDCPSLDSLPTSMASYKGEIFVNNVNQRLSKLL